MAESPHRGSFQFHLADLIYLVTIAGVSMCVFLLARTVVTNMSASVLAAFTFVTLFPGVGEFMRTGQPAWGIYVAMALQLVAALMLAICRFNFFSPTDWEVDFIGGIVIVTASFLAALGIGRGTAVVRRRWSILIADLGLVTVLVAGIVLVWKLR